MRHAIPSPLDQQHFASLHVTTHHDTTRNRFRRIATSDTSAIFPPAIAGGTSGVIPCAVARGTLDTSALDAPPFHRWRARNLRSFPSAAQMEPLLLRLWRRCQRLSGGMALNAAMTSRGSPRTDARFSSYRMLGHMPASWMRIESIDLPTQPAKCPIPSQTPHDTSAQHTPAQRGAARYCTPRFATSRHRTSCPTTSRHFAPHHVTTH